MATKSSKPMPSFMKKMNKGKGGAHPMGKPMPFKKGGMAAFEKSGKDKEMKGVKEGSAKDMAMDKKQMKAGGYRKGGMVKGC